MIHHVQVVNVLDPVGIAEDPGILKEVMPADLPQWGLGVEFSECKKLAGKRVVMRELDVIQIDDGKSGDRIPAGRRISSSASTVEL